MVVLSLVLSKPNSSIDPMVKLISSFLLSLLTHLVFLTSGVLSTTPVPASRTTRLTVTSPPISICFFLLSSLTSTENVSDPDRFYMVLTKMMNDLASAAAADPCRFATKAVHLDAFLNIYGLAQCTPTLS
ncbi:hypothetical protein H6P81_007137 [Aristolochia fimbriata]|uniref:Gnk2-homologous domain-containing protein n=1 Tax=Aristolochia fimbriata TaxID=158543 RepID=A0AAV7F3U2_ARIFI|nr:hypothetical protein H6P81_007137 [Aristolochia fimbriata]